MAGAAWRALLFGLLLVLALPPTAWARDGEHFLDRLETERRDEWLILRIYFTQALQRLSHTPEKEGNRLSIQFRRIGPVAGSLVGAALGEGGNRLVPGPGAAPQLRSVSATGSLEADPGVVLEFNGTVSYEVRGGPDTRSVEVLLKTSPAGDPEKADAGAEEAPAPVFTGDSEADRQLQKWFADARQALADGQSQRALAIYDKIVAAGVEPYRREAILALAAVRAERGQYAQAQAQYELFLQEYPGSPESARVERHLTALLEAADAQQAAEGGTAARTTETSDWQVFGSFDQFYLNDGGRIDGRGSDTYRSSLLTSANLTWQGRRGNMDIGGRFSGSYDHSFLSERDSISRVTYLYLDMAQHDGRHEGRLGRQRLSGSGVLGYFDGLHYQYGFADQFALHYVGGAPVRSARDGIDEDRVFHGLALDYHAIDDSWLVSLYGINQTAEGETDRRAVGAELRYLGDTYSLYSLLDYDFHFDELNIFHLFSNWRFSNETVVSLNLDYRRSPALTLSNAVQGQATDSLDELRDIYTDAELEQLALDRSLLYKSAYLSLTQQLTESWQLMLDSGLYSLRDTSDDAELGAAIDSDDWYLYGQLMGTSLFKTGDYYSAGLRYTDGERIDSLALLLRGRVPLGADWQLTPRLRLDRRERDGSGDQWLVNPSLQARYRLSRKTSIELDLGYEWSRSEQRFGDDVNERFYYLSLGYRHDF